MIMRTVFVLLACSLAVLGGRVMAETSQEKGLAIAKEADKRDLGWRESKVTLKMVLTNRHGQSSTRELRTMSMEVNAPGRGDNSLSVFDRPRDIDGTAFLSHTKIKEPDDQWLYLPALKRVKRISSANKSGPFMGSEFAYEDMLSFEVERYKFNWLRDEACGKLQCFVVEEFPVYVNSGYTRLVVWIDKVAYRRMRIDYYDRKKSLLKTLLFSDYKQYLGKYWRARRMEMKNHQTGKSTTLSFSDYAFQTGLNKNLFTPGRLQHIR